MENEHILRVSNLNVKLQNQQILDNVSFALKRGAALSIVGPNGAGKTVLFKALLNLMPYEGKIEWHNKARTGYVPQHISVTDIPISVKEFLSFKSSSNIHRALEQVRLHDASILSKNLGALSGGHLRRVLIAWALIDEPDVLMLDEPTTGVDLDSEEPIYLMLTELRRKFAITMLLITHNIHIVEEYSDQVLALNKCVTFFGESKQIMDPHIQRVVYGEPVCIESQSQA
jgi:zinc transport system ATP-binding protein